jgi:NAD(P)-dependent dehydrogenase (short-subunit alcohol dehydrogenase family)
MKDKVVIVTGGVKGIGLGIAKDFAGKGASVIVADLDQKECNKVANELATEFNVKCLGVKCDMSNMKDVSNLVKKTIQTFKKLDILVNNAGIYPSRMMADISEKDYDKTMDVNVKGLYFLMKESAKVMAEGSKIVNISSIASIIGFPGLTHYCATKGAVNALTRAAALEFAPMKITVNVVAPGAIDTPGAGGAMDENAKAALAQNIPMKRWGTPADIAAATVFLASDGADYITGQVIVVDGGWTVQ